MILEYLQLRLTDDDGTLIHVERLSTGEICAEGVLRPLTERQTKRAEVIYARSEKAVKGFVT